MVDLSEQEFRKLVAEAIDTIPERYASHIENLSFVVEREPNQAQRQRLHLVDGVTLYGLYEGVPLTNRGGNYSGVLPDKITLFMDPIMRSSRDMRQLKAQIQNTIWHEVAHYFGLDHGRIHELESS